MSFRFNNYPWDDARPLEMLDNVAANRPALAVFRSTLQAYEFPNSGMKEVFGRIQLPHSYKEGSTVKLHVHWGHTSGVNNGNIVWQCEYSVAKIGEAFPASTTTAATAAAVLGAEQYFHKLTSMFDITMTSKTISSVILFRLFRDPTATGDDCTGSAFLVDWDVHYQLDQSGSSQETSKS